MKKLLAALLLLAMLLSTVALASEYTFTTSSKANIRSGPGLEYDVITSVKKGAKLESAYNGFPDDRGVVWYRVYVSGKKTGWISEKCLASEKKSNIEDDPESDFYVKTQAKVYLRSEASVDSKALCTIPKGTKLLDYDGDVSDERGAWWAKITYKGQTGYVSWKYLTSNYY